MLIYQNLNEEYQPLKRSESNVWVDQPTYTGTVLYSVVTPSICCIGICGNITSLIGLSRKEFNSSIYTYLRVLAITDLADSILLFTSGLFRGALWHMDHYASYDALIIVPLSGAFSCWNVIATVCVALDRVVYLWHPATIDEPKFCRRTVARRLMLTSLILAVLFNIPHCFIYSWNEDGTLYTTEFFRSEFYVVHNWIKLTLFCVLPAIMLAVANVLLLRAVSKAVKMRQHTQLAIGKITKLNYWKSKEQISLTVILTLIVFFFLIGEAPTHLLSRKTATVILFDGNEERASNSWTLEIARQIFTVINAVDLASNFILYFLLFAPFRRSLVSMFCSSEKEESPCKMQVSVISMDEEKRRESMLKSIKDFWKATSNGNDEEVSSNYSENAEGEYKRRSSVTF